MLHLSTIKTGVDFAQVLLIRAVCAQDAGLELGPTCTNAPQRLAIGVGIGIGYPLLGACAGADPFLC